MSEIINSQRKPLEINYRPYDQNKPVLVRQEVKGGRELLIEATRRADGVIKVNFMGQTVLIPDKDYEGFLPEALGLQLIK